MAGDSRRNARPVVGSFLSESYSSGNSILIGGLFDGFLKEWPEIFIGEFI
jgi:hypothetical protein